VKYINNEAPHYIVFSKPLLLHLSLFKTWSFAPCSQTSTIYVLHLKTSDRVPNSYEATDPHVGICKKHETMWLEPDKTKFMTWK